jgi:hypothetical protein
MFIDWRKHSPINFAELLNVCPGFRAGSRHILIKLNSLKDEMWNTFNLGRRHPLKLRPARARKTFFF